MNKCTNHPERNSLSICHACGKEYCESCLDEGEEYYYCKNEECQKFLVKADEKIETPESIICPNCSCELELSIEERIRGIIHCPECEAAVNCKTNPPQILDEVKYTEIARSLNLGDIGLIKSILEDGNIDYYTVGENFLSVRPLLEPVRIFVNDNQLSEVKELLKDFELKIFGFSNRQDANFE